jgi:pimeloyl-ACP methyl ester carboxylesterase
LRGALEEEMQEQAAMPGESKKRVAAAALTAGRAVTRGLLWGAGKVVYGYRAIDPDVQRHLVHGPVVGLGMLLPRERSVVAKPDDGYLPLVLVHGMAGDPTNFYAMRAYFAAMGRRRVYAVHLSDEADVEAMAVRIRSFVAEVIAANDLAGDAKVDLVAHSQGGIASRLALEEPAFAARIATLVTLGTPHAGTYVARFTATRQGGDLRRESPVFARLATQLPWNSPVRLVAFWSTGDLLVLPAESAAVEGAENIEMVGFSHLAYLLSPRCWQQVWEVLLAAPAEQPAR